MGTVTKVPETRDMTGDELSADSGTGVAAPLRPLAPAARLLRPVPLRRRLQPLPRARPADGTGGDPAGHRLRRALHRAAHGEHRQARRTDHPPDRAGAQRRRRRRRTEPSCHSAGDGDRIALWFGLAFSLVNVTTAMCQIERGANRIYGNERDRPFHQKYLRGLVMSL